MHIEKEQESFIDDALPDLEAQERLHLRSLETLRTPQAGRRLGYWLLGLTGFFVLMAFVPWQQSVTGEGTITAFNPGNRPQTVQNVIPGRIQAWYIREGQLVRKGDTIISITEIKDDYFDPALLTRIAEQRAAKVAYIASTRDQIEFAGSQLKALAQARELTLSKTRNKLIQARNKIRIDSAAFEAQKVQYTLSQRQFARYQELYEKNGLISLTELEKRRQTLQEKYAYRVETENKYLNTRNEYINAQIELGSVEADYRDKIAKTSADRASKQAALSEAESELSKIRNKQANIVFRQSQYKVLAPQSGYVVRALKAGIGEQIKEGEPIATIMPLVSDKAVEMFVKPMDLPLLAIGQQVRIEFDGWPALQFSGWPNASTGTFGGIIAVVDFVASTNGAYRVLVRPDPKLHDWPPQVRLGSGARGWAMLKFVTIGYELWRQLNGFPPSPLRSSITASGIPDVSTSTGGLKTKNKDESSK